VDKCFGWIGLDFDGKIGICGVHLALVMVENWVPEWVILGVDFEVLMGK
jgi:hypothetical protein